MSSKPLPYEGWQRRWNLHCHFSYIPEEHEPSVILFSSWLGELGWWTVCGQRAGLVTRAFWREHPPVKSSTPVIWDESQFHLCSRAWKSRKTVSWWCCFWIISYSKHHSWLVQDVSVCQGVQIHVSIGHQPGEQWRGQCGTWNRYRQRGTLCDMDENSEWSQTLLSWRLSWD